MNAKTQLVLPAAIHLMHLDQLPQGVQRGEPRDYKDNNTTSPSQIGHSTGQTQDSCSDDSGDVVEGRIPPEVTQSNVV